MKYNLLFVDDETEILEGIQDSLRKHRKQWDMSFVRGGEEAIAELEKKNYDVIICDMRMPLVDGVDVLKHAKLRHPATIRIMLSGYSNIDRTIDVSSLAHRYLSKPCDLQELETTIRSSLELAEKLNNETIKEIAGAVDLLPVSNSQHQHLLELINSDDTPIAEIGQIIEFDIALTTKVLHLVNSAFFRRSRKIESAKEAATYLGTDLIKSIVLADQLFSLSVGRESVDRNCVDRLQKHSWLSASIAKHLMTDTEYADAAFTAALLHEIGSLVLCIERPDLLNAPVECNLDPNINNVNAQEPANDSIQEQLGAYLLNLLGMPYVIVEAIAFYQRPSMLERSVLDVVGALHIANHLAEVCMPDVFQTKLGDNLDTEYLNSLNLGGQLDNWLLSAQLIATNAEPGVMSTHSKNAA